MRVLVCLRNCHVQKCVEIHSNVFRFTVSVRLHIADLYTLQWVCWRTMSIQKSSTINDDYLSVLVRLWWSMANWKLHRAPLLLAINFWFLLELKQKPKEKRTTIEETLSGTHYFLWTPADTRLKTQQPHTHTRTKKRWTTNDNLLLSFFIYLPSKWLSWRQSSIVHRVKVYSLFVRYLSHEMCVHEQNR